MIELVPIFCILLASLAATFLGFRAAMRIVNRGKTAVRLFAAKHFLNYTEGWAAFRKNCADSGRLPGGPFLDRLPSFMLSLLEPAAPWRVEGVLNDVRVSVYGETRRKDRRSVVCFVHRAFFDAEPEARGRADAKLPAPELPEGVEIVLDARGARAELSASIGRVFDGDASFAVLNALILAVGEAADSGNR